MPENITIGKDCLISEHVTLGVLSREYQDKRKAAPPTEIGDNAVIRSGTTIYCDVRIGKNLQTGHNVLVREKTRIGNNVLLGSGTIIEGSCVIGNDVRIQSMVYVPLNTHIEDLVFIGPNAVLTNDRYPLRKSEELAGPLLKKGCSIGANATILPGIEIGEGAFVGAGAVVTKDVPPWTLAVGTPARTKPLPDNLKTMNDAGRKR